MRIAFALATLTLALSCAAPAHAAPPAAPGSTLQGEVLETRDVESYTYLRLRTAGGETWAAVPRAAVKAGTRVSISGATTMHNFESKTLKKTFDSIVFGNLAAGGASVAAQPAAAMAPAPAAAIKVAKASGSDARTVAEVVAGRGKLKDKTVLVRAQVVKVNLGIMGKNWLHVRDGTGSAADGSDDVLVTTHDKAAVGDVVQVRGIVHTDINLGSGYSYAVLIEDASVKK